MKTVKYRKFMILLAFILAAMPLFGAVQQVNASEAENASQNNDSNQSPKAQDSHPQQNDDVVSVAALKALIEQLAEEGEFENDGEANSDQTFIAADQDGTIRGYLNDPDADNFSYIQGPDGSREQIDTDSSCEESHQKWPYHYNMQLRKVQRNHML